MQKQWGSYGEKNLANELAGEKNEAFPPAFDNRINPGSESGTEDPIPELLCSFPPQEQNQSFQMEDGECASKLEDTALWGQALESQFTQIALDTKVKDGMWTGDKFSPAGWSEVVQEFGSQTGRPYTKAQLQGKWHRLRKDWSIMKWIITDPRHTGVQWDAVNCAIMATEEQWQRIIQQRKGAKHYRKGGLPNYDQLTKLFHGSTAKGTLPILSKQESVIDEEEFPLQMLPENVTQRPAIMNVEESDEGGEEIEMSQPLIGRGSSCGLKRKAGNLSCDDKWKSIIKAAKNEKWAAQAKLMKAWTAESLARTEVIMKEQAAVAQKNEPEPGPYSIPACIAVLNVFGPISDEMYGKALESFRDEQWRQMWITMPHERRQWYLMRM